MYQIPLDPTAVQGRRIGAWIIDFVFAGVLFIVAANVFLDAYTRSGNLCSDDGEPPASDEVPTCQADLFGEPGFVLYDEATDQSTFISNDGAWVPVAVFIGYGIFSFVFLEGIVGGSIGKLLIGLRVVTAEGANAGVGRSMVRFGLWIVDAFPYCFPLVGLITGLTTKGHRRVGDMAAGTFVVSRADVGRPVSIPGLNAPAGMAYATGSNPVPHLPPSAAPWGTPDPTAPWGPPAGGSTWGAPEAPPWGAPPEAGTPSPAPVAPEPDTSKPQWDAARNTYIQWDVHRNRWLQWDTTVNEWQPIDQ